MSAGAPSVAPYWAVIPFAPGWVVANIDAGVLYLLAVSSVGVYGIIGMRERAASIGAALDISSEVGVGTTIRCEIRQN